MIDYSEFRRLAPAIAEPIAERFVRSGIGMLGTVRTDGSPRVSPIEVGFVDGRLHVGMMPDSRKHADVLRDPRCCLVNAIADREDLAGEGKLFGALQVVDDRARAQHVLDVLAAAAGFDPGPLEGSPMFELRIAAAAWQRVVDDAWVTLSWREGHDGLVERRRTN